MTSERGSQDDVFVNRTNSTTVGPPVGSYSLAESGALGESAMASACSVLVPIHPIFRSFHDVDVFPEPTRRSRRD
jgi:hypothetical protein